MFNRHLVVVFDLPSNQSLLFLVLSSCMVALIRNFGNKFFFSSTNMYSQQTFDLPTIFSSTNTGMDILPRNIPDNYNKVKGKTSSSKPQSSRASSMSLTKSSVAYYKK